MLIIVHTFRNIDGNPYVAALYEYIKFFKPLCGPSQPAWLRVSERVKDHIGIDVGPHACVERFKWFQNQPDPTGGPDSPDPVKRLIGPMKELQAELDHEQASWFYFIVSARAPK